MREIKIFRQHGRQYVPDLKNAKLPEIFRGRPVISSGITEDETRRVADLCPVGAIGMDPCSIDLGKCVFCKACAFSVPDKISFTSDYRMAVNDPADLIIKKGEDRPMHLRREKVKPEVQRLFRNALKLRQVSAGGDNAAEMELNAAGNVNFDMGRYGIEFVASPRHADGLVITGPVTENMAEALQICFDATPSPKIIILVATDAISGGIFSGSPALKRDFLYRYTIDLYVPGNPPHPLTFINGVLDLIGK